MVRYVNKKNSKSSDPKQDLLVVDRHRHTHTRAHKQTHEDNFSAEVVDTFY